jgi:hypothetical protein
MEATQPTRKPDTRPAYLPTTDGGHAKQRTGKFVKGARVYFLARDYFKGEIPADTAATIARTSNAGFRGIEATVVLADGRRVLASLDNLAISLRK